MKEFTIKSYEELNNEIRTLQFVLEEYRQLLREQRDITEFWRNKAEGK